MNVDVLGAMITPVALLSGTGLFLLTINTRFARVIDRIRALNALLERLRHEPLNTDAAWLAEQYRAQLGIFARRGRALSRALFAIHAGFSFFLGASMALALLVPFGQVRWPAVLLACAGMGCLLYAAIRVTVEIADSFTAVQIDLEIGRRTFERFGAQGSVAKGAPTPGDP